MLRILLVNHVGIVQDISLVAIGWTISFPGIVDRSKREVPREEKYRGMFETQKSGYLTSSGEIGLDIKTHASPKVGQDQISRGVSVLYS